MAGVTDTGSSDDYLTTDTDADSQNRKRNVARRPGGRMNSKYRRARKFRAKCMNKKWTCDEIPFWQVYMKSYVEDIDQLEREDIFKRRKPAQLSTFPRVKSEEDVANPFKCVPVGAFHLKDELALPNKLDRTKMVRLWKNMRANLPVHDSKSDMEVQPSTAKSDKDKWPGLWPCTTRNLVNELRLKQKKTRKRRNIFPCDPDEDDDVYVDPTKDFSDRKELGHARIPKTCPEPKGELLVDRAAGEQPGLVDGDYIIFELPSKARGTRIYADVCLRGLKGMHLPELHVLRTRQNTWKFCFYQAIIALLAKTQLRYKYAWSANIDYIYDHAWMLYTHIGMINVKEKQRLDDIVVYNYKYSVELELIQELNDVPIVTDIPWEYEERNMRRKMMLERKELMNVKLEIGTEKLTDRQRAPVHAGVKRIEDWFDKLPIRFRNCIFRTTRFCLAFWRDNLFWYLYNPYRCDEFGYWNDDGYACILKFCSKESLKRHLMILLLRAYVYTLPTSAMKMAKDEMAARKAENETTNETANEPTPVATNETVNQPKDTAIENEEITGEERTGEESTEEQFFTIQIFNIVYHCCQIHNLKLLERGAPKPPQHLVKKKTIDDCPFDPLDLRDPCTIEQEEGDLKDAIEKPTWFKLYKVTWAKCVPISQKKKTTKEISGMGKMRWHQYLVEESNKLFSLWGEVHISDGMFDRENRGMQTYACYVVCAGMTRIMAPEYWSSKTLDVIVMCGDRYYTHSKLEAEFKSTKNEYSHVNCWSKYLMSHFKIGETMFETNVLPAICGRLYSKANKYLWQALEQMFLKYHFGILTCESTCLGVFKFCGAYYMCDVNSFGPPLFAYGEGAAYLLRATYFYKFLTVLVLTIGSPECSQFALNPIEILKVVDVGSTSFPAGRIEKKDRRKGITKVKCPYDEEKKKQMRRWKHRRMEVERTINKTCCKEKD